MRDWRIGFDGEKGATLSHDGMYRWCLWRAWSEATPLVFIMLNPSTADATQDDPTIRRCIGFARREGAGGIVVANLSAYRATDPKDLEAAYRRGEAVHAGNEDSLVGACLLGRVVLAWGAGVRPWMNRAAFVVRRPDAHHSGPRWCLGRTKRGEPRHPLMVRADAPLVRIP